MLIIIAMILFSNLFYKKMNAFLKIMVILSSVFGIGKIQYMPGTFGSLSVLPLYFFLIKCSEDVISAKTHMSIILYILIIISFFIIHYAHKVLNIDDKSIVIDEFIGQLLTLTLTVNLFFNETQSKSIKTFEILSVFFLSFVVFRFFDIIKPLGISYIDKNFKNCFGVILDDIIAAIYSFIFIFIIKSSIALIIINQ